MGLDMTVYSLPRRNDAGKHGEGNCCSTMLAMFGWTPTMANNLTLNKLVLGER